MTESPAQEARLTAIEVLRQIEVHEKPAFGHDTVSLLARTLLDLAQQLEQAERQLKASRQVRLVYLTEVHAYKDILAEAEQRIKELQQVEEAVLGPDGRHPLQQRIEELEGAREWYDAHKRSDGSYDGEMYGDPFALTQDSATAEATQETVVREDSDEG
jgi:hypothetical protein